MEKELFKIHVPRGDNWPSIFDEDESRKLRYDSRISGVFSKAYHGSCLEIFRFKLTNAFSNPWQISMKRLKVTTNALIIRFIRKNLVKNT